MLLTRPRPPDWTRESITLSIARLVESILLHLLLLLTRMTAVSLVAMVHTTLYQPPLLPPHPVPTEQQVHPPPPPPPPHIISTPSRSPSPHPYTIRMPHINSININSIKRRIDQDLKDERRVMVIF